MSRRLALLDIAMPGISSVIISIVQLLFNFVMERMTVGITQMRHIVPLPLASLGNSGVPLGVASDTRVYAIKEITALMDLMKVKVFVVPQSVPLAILSAIMDSVSLVPGSVTWMTIAGMVVMRFIVIARLVHVRQVGSAVGPITDVFHRTLFATALTTVGITLMKRSVRTELVAMGSSDVATIAVYHYVGSVILGMTAGITQMKNSAPLVNVVRASFDARITDVSLHVGFVTKLKTVVLVKMN